jgi:hypothetical protein
MTEINHIAEDLERKANILREIHVASSKKCKFWINIFLILTIILSIAITFFSLTVPYFISLDENGKNIFGIIVAIAGLAILFLSVSDRIFGFNERYAIHIQGIKLLTDFIRDCHQFRHSETKKTTEEKRLLKLNALQNSYSQIQQILPISDISDAEFLKIKQRFLLKVKISKKLDEDPSINIEEEIRKN